MRAAPPEHAIREFLLAGQETQTRFLADLVRIPSDNPPGDCAAPAERAAVLLEALGLTVERHSVPGDLARACGMVSATNLVIRHRFGEGPVVALNAHGDVVPPGEGWSQDPYGAAVLDGWMYGRGAAVSKSDFATYAWALLALASCGAQLRGTVELHLTFDEEVGGEIGPPWLLREGISHPDLVIGAGFSYAVVNAHNGCLHLEIQVDGRSAHAAMPATGIDALEAANAILSALYAWRPHLAQRRSGIEGIGSPQMTVGLIRGGINTNVVPDRVVMRLDRRIIPEEQPEQAESELREVIDQAASGFPEARVTVRRILLAAPLVPLPGGDRLAALLCARATAIMGEPVRCTGVPLYTDARHYAAAGIPIVLYGAGPHTIQEANAHRADERLPLSDLYKATEVVALTLYDLLSVEGWGGVSGVVAKPSLAELSIMDQDGFVQALDGIYEHSPWVAARAWTRRPFATADALHAALAAAVEAAGADEQLALIRAHPELAGRAAVRGELTELSRQEQGGAGLDRCSPEEFAELTRLNADYGARFGFPFVVAVRGQTRSSIIDALTRRLHNTRAEEVRESLRQIDRIACIRLRDRLALGDATALSCQQDAPERP